MSKMSLKPRLKPTKRKEVIKNNIAFKKIGEHDEEDTIAWLCGVDRKTIYRDIKKMRKSGEWEEFVEATVLKLSQTGDIDDATKLREWMKIYAKGITDKHEVEAKGDLIFRLEAWRPDADSEDKVHPA